MARLIEHRALDLGVVTLSPTWVKRLFKNKIFLKMHLKIDKIK